MTNKFSVWTSNQSMKSNVSMKEDEQQQSQNLENISIDAPASDDVDTLTSVSAPVTRPTKDAVMTTKRNHKHKHHHHHRRRCRHHHHHHHDHHHHKNQLKKKNQPATIVPSISHMVNSNISPKIPNDVNQETTLKDEQKASLIACTKDQTAKSNKGNIPLQSVENILVSHRKAPTDEAQVGNFPSMCCTHTTPSIVNTNCFQTIEQIVYQDDCCLPAVTSCCVQQPEPIICVSQPQPQQQVLLCTDPISTQDFICSSSRTIQPTIVSQVPFCASTATTLANQPLLCVPQPATIQQSPSIIIQQQQPQFIQQQQQQPQLIQVPQAQPGQYIQITSATPQIIQTIQAPSVQTVQPQFVQAMPVGAQVVAASPQILYQRPYDPIVIPVQNQQLAVAQNPVLALSQPSYAPVRRPTPGPRLFQQALVRTVANRTGVPFALPNIATGLPLASSSAVGPTRGAALLSAGRASLTNAARPPPPPSSSSPIVPLTPGGLLIPFQPSEPPRGMVQGALPRRIGQPSNARNYDLIRQQIQQRARLLADIQRLASAPSISPTRNLVNSDLPISRPTSFPPLRPMQPSAFASNAPPPPPPPPPMFRSQTPYTNRNPNDVSSSSSSSRSSRSSASNAPATSNNRSAPSNLIYSVPSVTGTGVGSNLSGPSAAPYQSFRP